MKQWIALAALAAVSVGAQAQTYPGSKPVSIVVPFTAGGPTDRVARDLAEAMRKQIPGSNFVVENAAGAGGTIGAAKVAKAAPDGHTLLMAAVGNVVLQPMLSKQGGADLVAKLRPVSTVSTAPHVLVTSGKLPIRSVQELVDYARANPGKLSYGSTGVLTSPHLTMELVAQKLGIELLHVPYKGSADLMQAILGGQLMAAADSTATGA